MVRGGLDFPSISLRARRCLFLGSLTPLALRAA
jgi:hypothetical protein